MNSDNDTQAPIPVTEALSVVEMATNFYIRDLEKKWHGHDDDGLVARQRVRIERAINALRTALGDKGGTP